MKNMGPSNKKSEREQNSPASQEWVQQHWTIDSVLDKFFEHRPIEISDVSLRHEEVKPRVRRFPRTNLLGDFFRPFDSK